MSFVYVSHAGEDKKRIRPIVDSLLDEGFDVFVDRPQEMGYRTSEIERQFRFIPVGDEWDEAIKKALRECDVILACFSKALLQDRRVLREDINFGTISRKIVSCRVDDLTPEQLQANDTLKNEIGLNALHRLQAPALDTEGLRSALKRLGKGRALSQGSTEDEALEDMRFVMLNLQRVAEGQNPPPPSESGPEGLEPIDFSPPGQEETDEAPRPKSPSRATSAVGQQLKAVRPVVLRMTLAASATLLVIGGLARLGAVPPSNERPDEPALAVALSSNGTGSKLSAVATPDGGMAVYRGGTRLGMVRGHGAPIVEAAFLGDGNSLLTIDARGEARTTRLTALQARSAFDMREPLAVLGRELWASYGFPIAREVQGWPLNPAATAWPTAIGLALLAFGLWAGPRLVMAGAGLVARRNTPPEAKPANAPAPGLPRKDNPEMVTLRPGRFLMGAAEGEDGASEDEYPQHEVVIDYRLAIGKYPVTFAQWDTALEAGAKLPRPDDQGWGRGERPVINVSWEDAQAYIAWLNEALGLTGRPDAYRLPSEAEWEYACRAGAQTRFSFGDEDRRLGDHAWFSGNAGGKTHPVGRKKPNSFSLYDMHGNVSEWCADTWHENYEGAPSDGLARKGGDASPRVLRGGSWKSVQLFLRSADRYKARTTFSVQGIGFRLARTVSP